MTSTETAGGHTPAVLPRNERALQTKVLAWLNAFGGHWENRSPGAFGSTGVPDITGIFLGRFVAIELKHPRHHHGPKPDDTRWPAQKRYLVNVYTSGGCALATNNLRAVKNLVREIARWKNSAGISLVLPSYLEDWGT